MNEGHIDNGPDTRLWYVARTRHGQELKVKEMLQNCLVEGFIPTTRAQRVRRGKKVQVTVPLISNMVFVHCSRSQALSLVNGRGVPMYYIIDHSTGHMLIVPDKQMDDFIRVVTEDPTTICTEMPDIPLGADVRITAGTFEGVEGKVVMLPNRTYVLVSIGRILCAKVKVPRSCVRCI